MSYHPDTSRAQSSLAFFQRSNSYYEKIDHSHSCAFDARLDAGVLLKRTPDDHDHNASNHCHVGASAFDGKNAYASPLWSASDGRRQLLSTRQLFTAEPPIV